MEKEKIFEKLVELGNIPGFEEAISAVETKEAAVEVLREYGWSLGADEFDNVVLPILMELVSNNQELTEENLENVTGGGFVLTVAGVLAVAWMAKGFFNGLGCE